MNQQQLVTVRGEIAFAFCSLIFLLGVLTVVVINQDVRIKALEKNQATKNDGTR